MSGSALKLEILLDEGRTSFEPGARLSGVAAWTAPSPPRALEVRLTWTSRSGAGRDVRIEQTLPLDAPSATERRPFAFTLPAEPYSFRGQLVSLTWSVELVAQPGDDTITVPIVVAPGAAPLELVAVR
ncbi:MAG TPA: hypothetical protein VHJ20_12295 [Polyangia bacterium]|nr:hypothetical protein [Polyangia bacterium]